jgi:hypothetical protein
VPPIQRVKHAPRRRRGGNLLWMQSDDENVEHVTSLFSRLRPFIGDVAGKVVPAGRGFDPRRRRVSREKKSRQKI